MNNNELNKQNKQVSKFITFEGCEGVGKSTQVRLVKEYCEKNNIDAVFTREPGGTQLAEKIRNVILEKTNTTMDAVTELLLYIASRRQLTSELISPLLKKGKIVFCDRYIDSTLAYQGYARGLDLDFIKLLNKEAMGDAEIFMTIFLDVNADNGFIRKGGADLSDRLESEGIEFHNKVYNGFKQIAKDEPNRVKVVDASGSKLETHEKIIRLLKSKNIF